jgi:hypothetical protein
MNIKERIVSHKLFIYTQKIWRISNCEIILSITSKNWRDFFKHTNNFLLIVQIFCFNEIEPKLLSHL